MVDPLDSRNTTINQNHISGTHYLLVFINSMLVNPCCTTANNHDIIYLGTKDVRAETKGIAPYDSMNYQKQQNTLNKKLEMLQ